MKKIYITGLLFLMVMSVFAQKVAKPSHEKLANSNPDKIEFMKGQMVVCPANFEDANTYVPMAKEVEEAMKSQKARGTAAKAEFIVTYNGFSPAAQKSFQAAVDIWANLISSPVPIRINATWRKIDSGTGGGTILGQASPGDFTRNFPGQQRSGTWYPIALAEKISGQDLNSVNEPDITAEFNSAAAWYLGVAAPPSNQFDFTSVVLHELCHGLGFTSSFRVSGNNGSWGFGTGSPFAFDPFLENAGSQQLISTKDFANTSAALKTQLTSDNLFFNSATAIASNKGEKPRIYAPITYEPGSSISHVNDATYPSGNANSLMTAGASLREVIRDPGPIVKGMFADMGWKGTSLVHTRIKNIETAVSKVTIKATITSDTTLVAGSAKLFYTENDTIINAKPLNMVRVGTTNVYSVDVPVTKNPSIIRYYMTVDDNYKRKNTAPAEAPSKGYYGLSIGNADTSPPFVTTEPPTIVPSTVKPDVFANIEDNFEHGVDTAYVEYQLNGQVQKPFGLKRYNAATDDKAYSQGRNDAFAFLAKNPFVGLKLNDRVLYRIVAIDKSKNKNKTVLPSYFNTPGTNVVATPDYFEFFVNDLKTQTPALKLSIDFNTSPNDDFAKIGGWDITLPTGFTDGALHSAHPYKNGGNEDLQSNTLALLRTPIQVKDNLDSAVITFDEVVLVEPGEPNSIFGNSDFYDYVVTEGSFDGGASWVEFEAGYDANADATWLKTFNASGANGTFIAADGKSYASSDSRGVGLATMYKKRTIKMLSSGDFLGGDVILIRFRLFSDELTYGWGWAIDNLKIQVPPPPPILATEQTAEKTLTVFPNPTPDEVRVTTGLSKPGRVRMEVISSTGVKILEKEYLTDISTFYQKIDVRDFTNGTYLVRLYTENGVVVKRFSVNR
jgi:Secretion system C-terminal sorting domain